MKVVYRTIIQITIASRIMAVSFENIMKSLPADIPGEFKNIMLKMYMKHPKAFDTLEPDVKVMVPTKSPAATHDNWINNSIFIKEKSVSKTKMDIIGNEKKTKTSAKLNKIVRSDTSTTPTSSTPPGDSTPPSGETTTPGSTTIKVPEPKFVEPPPMMAPVPLPIPLPLPMPMYPRVPMLLPMKSYFEPVIHDHPPIYEIQDLIREDKKKWKHRYHKKDKEASVEKPSEGYESDTDTDTSSEETDFGSDYYDALIHIKG